MSGPDRKMTNFSGKTVQTRSLPHLDRRISESVAQLTADSWHAKVGSRHEDETKSPGAHNLCQTHYMLVVHLNSQTDIALRHAVSCPFHSNLCLCWRLRPIVTIERTRRRLLHQMLEVWSYVMRFGSWILENVPEKLERRPIVWLWALLISGSARSE